MSLASSLYDSLPRPSKVCPDPERGKEGISSLVSKLNVNNKIPAYGQRKGWIPRTTADYGSGGAFPEIPVVQYPLDMGRTSVRDSKTLPIQLDAEGKIKYDVIVKQGSNKNKIVYNALQDLLPSEVLNEDDPRLQKPDEDEVQKTTEATKLALEKLTQSKISAALPVRRAEATAPAKYIRYTPSNQMAVTDGSDGKDPASGPGQRIIRMIEVQKDPLEPPKFRINKKIPGAPPSPPPPVLHSPPRKITVKEQQEWKIPPTISNWKNAKGYTIPLDKRLAADGRGLQQTHINPKFAEVTEALYIADRKAREEVELRSQMEKKVAAKEKEKKEENLRNLAKKAREERAGIRSSAPDQTEDDELQDREDIRRERHKDRLRDKNISRAAPDKRTRLERERERDVSEQIALGVANPRVNLNEVQFDQRLFNQSKGLGTGFGDDDDYGVYDKPWRGDQELAKNLYRPSRSAKDSDLYGDDLETLKNTNRFVPDKEFSGVDRTAGTSRSGPVQFERHRDEEDDDPFGLGKFLNEAKTASKRADSGRSDRHHETNRASYKKSRHD